jgi:hypothetical protein
MQFDSRRAKCPGYLEFIWRADVERPEGTTPQAVAYITDIYSNPGKPRFWGVYGTHVVEGPSVASVKSELFALIEAGQ